MTTETMKSATMQALDLVTEKVSALIAETKADPDYNAKSLATDAIRIAKHAVEIIPGVEFMPGEPNSKTGIRSIDLLPYITCHARCRETCGKINPGRKFNRGKCYAFKLMYRNPRTCARWAINTALLILHPDRFFEGVDWLMRSERFVRCFVAGDANIPGFFDRLCDCLIKNPHCRVQGFSKCYEVINAYIDKHGKLPDNLKMLLSGWEDMKPDNPHNLPVSDVYDETLPAGWLSCGGNCLNCACVGLGCWKAENGDIVGLKKH